MIPPKSRISDRAHIASLEHYRTLYKRSVDEPEAFWREQSERLTWFHPPYSIFDHDPDEVDVAWFGGGRLNACFNCVDRHLPTRGEKTAIHWVGDEPGEYRSITYRELKHLVARMANVIAAGDTSDLGDVSTLADPSVVEKLVGVS